MQKDAEILKTNKNPLEPKPEALKPKAIKSKKDAGIQKKGTKINPSKAKPDGLKPNAIKCKKTQEVKEQKKIHRSLNPTALNQRQ